MVPPYFPNGPAHTADSLPPARCIVGNTCEARMAAPCWRFAARPLWQKISGSVKFSASVKSVVRSVSSTPQTRGAQKLSPVSAASPWALHGAVCLQRLPVISQDRSPIEEQFMDLMQQMELEKSLLSDHEQRLLEDAERMSRKQEADYDSDEEEEYGGQEIVMAQDLEDAWEQKLKQFQPASRTKASDTTDVSSSERCLGDSLVLLVKQDVGSQRLWLLPQLPWEAGETLRQTAERALATLPGAELKATFLGNAPCGFYKYKFPQNIQTESRVGAKVFFFKAMLSGGGHLPLQKDTFAWVRTDELQDYLKPEYLKQVKRFIMNL
ncbi:39S ribosomal protein L46, mitochondrial [Colossoma macropomum]|uniref:39S ribosomal protein L46, mitochondrial n=1 Tax=Colossoma macropomum TaxID=42526 RepID=UPI00186533AB|nr:39S ribosomal protein L46, mitochondrial [Colossoma macropomum]